MIAQRMDLFRSHDNTTASAAPSPRPLCPTAEEVCPSISTRTIVTSRQHACPLLFLGPHPAP